MTLRISGTKSVQGIAGTAATAAIYLGTGFLGYAIRTESHIDFDDPWLYGLVLAWPVVVACVVMKWLVLAMAACVAIIAACVGWDEWRDRRLRRIG